ncbi:DUF3152 domain-containing protein [Streptomyces mobaraensis]|uniref:DUF3152 domain-containing protein n=2 Tax=Streptomyces mobaraensis TaxID=35621 RepID=A0A5N5WDM5_STRMB|nr:hypothetical protein H340_00040 [Streptomyces mobaraensis NBRC 13819 = DSM 40847]KAB7851025.1 DUF3152 domain-containing protein [Streptomyces mobaraensis]
MGKHSARAPQAPQATSGGRTEEAPEVPGAREAVRTAERPLGGEDDGPSGRPEPVVRSAPRGPAIGWGVIGRQGGRSGTSGSSGASGSAGASGASRPAGRSRTGGARPKAARVPEPRRGSGGRGDAPGGGAHRAAGGRGRAVTGVAAAVVTAVLAVFVAGQVEDGTESRAQAQTPDARNGAGAASRSDSRPTPRPPAAPVTYEQKMAKKYPLDQRMPASGEFMTVGGHDKAPGKGEVLRYRVDVEKGLPLDGGLFATAVHRTLNDDRSWGHGGTRTFERVSSGRADFVVTLASPATTAKWCAKSDLDITVDNVSCDSAATDRVMINAYRWAQGAETYGDRMYEYRQMLINHEVGHRLGHNHESCGKAGAPAPVMMQQTKFLTTDGVTCKPNAWPFPK